jgi:hypothetical protein
MDFFSPVSVVFLLALAVGFLFPAARALYRFYHWRRSLERMERTEWTRLVRMLRTSGEESL